MKWFGAIADYIRKSLLTARGDLITHDGASVVKLTAGSAYQILRMGGSGVVMAWNFNKFIHDDAGIVIRYKVLDIGDWDMDTIGGVSIAHGITNAKYIFSVSANVRLDTSVSFYLLTPSGGGSTAQEGMIMRWDDTHIHLQRDAGGFYDTGAFSTTPFNRGRILVTYGIVAIS